MIEPTLHDHERDVEVARSKLTHDLAILRSPKTFADFSDDLKHDALDTTDALLDKAKSAAQSTASGLLEDLKAKAAANPAAALAIGAGIGWRLFRHPPIATALIGLGLFSLLRTNASRPTNGHQPDYWAQGQQRLKEQGLEAVSKATDAVAEAQEAASAKAADLVEAAKEKLGQWGDDTQAALGTFKSRVQTEAGDAADAARRVGHDLQDQIMGASAQVADTTKKLFQDAVASGSKVLADDNSRNNLYLGLAGVAVAAALGIAYQKRIAQSEDA